MDDAPLTSEEMDAILEARFPDAFSKNRGRPAKLMSDVIYEWGPLTEEHVAAAQEHIDSGEAIGVSCPSLKSIRHTHHRLAQFLAMGMDESTAAKLTNYAVNRVSILKSDPAFKELLAHYSQMQEEGFAEFVETAAALNMDMLGRLQQILDEEPEKLTPTHILEAIKVLSDRTGNAPVQRTISNVNVNIGMGEKLRLARERAANAERLRITSIEDT